MGNYADESNDKQQIQIWARKIKGHKSTLGNIRESLQNQLTHVKMNHFQILLKKD